jgi:hypothetical protein
MGNTIWVETKKGTKKKGGERDNSIMLRLDKNLAGVARKLKVTKLSEFYDYSVLAEAFGEELGDGVPIPEEKWSDSTEGLASLQAIYSHLSEHPEDLKFKPDSSREYWPKMLMEELKYCVSVLKKAAAAKAMFRLVIVP